MVQMYKICFYITHEYAEQVKNAMFKAGGGKIGNYSCCAWQTSGEGQFMPLAGSDAFIGEKNVLEKVAELKVEMVCEREHINAVINALKQSHPYEEPAYQVIEIVDL